jgi:hypothetical protein
MNNQNNNQMNNQNNNQMNNQNNNQMNNQNNNQNNNQMNNQIDKAGLAIAKSVLVIIIQIIEFVNERFNPLGVSLGGWSEQIKEDMSNYDEILLKLLLKYKGNTESEPEMQLLMALLFSGITFGISKKFSGNNGNNNNNNENNKGGVSNILNGFFGSNTKQNVNKNNSKVNKST